MITHGMDYLLRVVSILVEFLGLGALQKTCVRYQRLKIIKGKLYYKKWFYEHNSKALHRRLVPFGYVIMAIDTQLFCFMNVLRKLN